MLDNNYSPNGFNVHRYDNENENVNEFDVTISGNAMFKNKNDAYPDYSEKDRYERQRSSGQNVQINHIDKLNEINNPGVIINKNNEDVMDPNTFFNNTSQVYLLYNLGENLKK